jgi:hypothetical protein
MNHKKQHYIPQTYLSSWCDIECPEEYEKYVWMFSYNGEIVKKKSPKNIFHETDLYTIVDDDGNRVLDIEHGFSELENVFTIIRDNKLNKHISLTLEERYYILLFVAAIHNRTPSIRDYLSKQYCELLELGRLLKQDYEKASPEKRSAMASIGPIDDKGRTFTLDDIEKLSSEPLQTLMLPRINAEFNCYSKMFMSILCTDDEIGFITSDNPCVWFDPEAYKRPPMYRAAGLGYKTIEVTMPISPSQAIFISYTPLPFYVPVKISNVDSINRKTRFSAYRYFIVNRNYKNDYWFKDLKP